jgi:hypothetical protein
MSDYLENESENRAKRHLYAEGQMTFDELAQGKTAAQVIRDVHLISDTNSYFDESSKNDKLFADLTKWLEEMFGL